MKSNLPKSLLLYLLSTIAALSLFAACAAPAEKITTPTIEVTDQLGRVVRLDKVPQRIISLAPSNTEILFALGLDDRLVAVTDYCDFPPEAKEKPSTGGFSTPNIEEVVALSPDLIVATSIHESRIIPQLEQKGFTVLALNPKTLGEVMEAIALVGGVTGKEDKASELVAVMQNRIKAVTDKTDNLPPEQRPGVFYCLWHDPLKSAGSGTLQQELIQKAGGINIAQDLSDYANISLEAVIVANPGVMIAGVSHGSGQDLNFQFIQTEPRLSETAARQHENVYMIDGNLTSRPGPRIVDGLEAFARFIHPELFGKAQ